MFGKESELLGSHISILSGYAFPSEFFASHSGVPLVRIRNLLAQSTDTHYLGPFDDRWLIDDGDVLIGMDGDFNVVRWSGGPALLNQRVCKVVSNSPALDEGYLYHALQIKLPEVHRRTPQTTVRHLAAQDIEKISIHIIPIREQCRIAEILDTVDEAIHTTEALIEKLKQIQAGMLHDLLTRGIDENGELRDPYANPEQFRDSQLGRLPNSWEVASLRTMKPPDRAHIKTGPFGSSLKGEHWVDDGVPVITIGSLGEGHIIRPELLFVSEHTARALAAYTLEEGDLVFSRVADVGRSVRITEAEHGWIMSSNLMRISLDQRRVLPDYALLAVAYSQSSRRQVRQFVNAGGRDIANTNVLDRLTLSWPPIDEQQAIVDCVRVHDRSLQTERSFRDKLCMIKSALMDDLLTGRVRVTGEAEKVVGVE